jgi:molecular chaperone Hsp33
MNEVQSFLLEEHGIRGSIVRLRETWLQVVAQHNYPERVRELLGEAVAATILLGNQLKDQPRISIQLNGRGALKLLLIQCTEDLKVRGLAQWSNAHDGQPLLGEGRLAVNIDTGGQNGFFQGIVPLVSPMLDECLQAYFAQSEQLTTRLFLFGGGREIGGLLLQTLPRHEKAKQEFAAVAALAGTITARELHSMACDSLLPKVFGAYPIRLFAPRPVLHDCRCTAERLASVARMLGADELESLLAEQGRVELKCEFCNRTFRFSRMDVDAILRGGLPGSVLH